MNQAKLDFARAIPDFTMAIKLDSAPNSGADPKQIGDHWNFCGMCYYEMGQYEDALRHYESAIKKDNSNGLYYFNRAVVKGKLDKLEQAIDDYTKAIENNPENSYKFNSLFNRGVCNRRLGRLDESIKDLREACTL